MNDPQIWHNFLNPRPSKEQIREAAIWVEKKKSRVKMMMKFIHETTHVSERLYASWIMTYVFEKNPDLISPYWSVCIDLLKNNTTNSIKRNITRSLQDIDIPQKYHAELIDIGFRFILNPKEDIAIRAFTLKMLLNFTTEYPEIKNELVESVKMIMPNASKGLNHRCKMVLNSIV